MSFLHALAFALAGFGQQPPPAAQTPPPKPEQTAPVRVDEEVIVRSTRSDKRVQDEALRVEVLGREEIEEKLLMTPGDIAMLLSETTGLRVQVTSPGLGGASLRIQGLRGRYTQLLSDGLPLYGGQSGSIGLLQIPPMDLGQVEVIKGVASSLFGSSALGGVVNLISRRPADRHEREVLFNQTSLGGTDAVWWSSGPIAAHWKYSLVANADRQIKQDKDGDGWADVPEFQRISARPRLQWDNGAGRSVLLTAGGMAENRGGGSTFVEGLKTRRADAGVVSRWLIGSTVVGARGSFMNQAHRHQFGDVVEHDAHRTGFGEVSLTKAAGRHTVVIGGALQADAYRASELSRFNYNFWVPSVFAQDDVTVSRSVAVSASARIDRHSRYGTIASPRLSALWRPADRWSVRLSGGAGYFAPTPLTEEAEAVGLTRLRAFAAPAVERAQSYSADVSRSLGNAEFNFTVFGSRVNGALAMAQAGFAQYDLVPLAGATDTVGAESLVRLRLREVTVVGSYTFVHSTEPDVATGVREEVALTPQHSTGLTAMWEREGVGRVGLEFYFTGTQRLEDNPFRNRSIAYPYFGALAERKIGRVRLFVNSENLSNKRQTKYDPLVRPFRRFDGRWTVDAWAPLDGFVVNAGFRVAF
jgi:outer membrane receptor for ferrienterochelin and colicins